MRGMKRTPKSSKKITKQVKEVSTKKKLCKDIENDKLSQYLLLKPQVNFNDSNDFRTPERKINTCKSRLRNQIDYIKFNEPQGDESALIKKNTKQSILNTPIESITQTHSEIPRKSARKSSQTKNEDSSLQNVTSSPKFEKDYLPQTAKLKPVKSPSKQHKNNKSKTNSRQKTFDSDERFLEENFICNPQNQQTSKSRLPKSQILSESFQSSDNKASFSGKITSGSSCESLKIIKQNSSFTSGEEFETSNNCGTYLRNRRKISHKFSDKGSKKCVPTVTSSLVPTATSSLVPTATSSFVSTVPSSLFLAVPSSHVPTVTSSLVPNVTSSLVPTATSHVPTVTSSLIPNVTSSLVPMVISSLVPMVTSSLVPTATSSPVPNVTSSLVPTVTSPLVPTVTSSHISTVTSSLVPNVISSLVPTVTSSLFPTATSSLVPTVTSSLVPMVTSFVPTVTSSLGPMATSSLVPNVTSSCVPTVTSSLVPTETEMNIETGFNHEQNKLKSDNDFTKGQMKKCPTCKDDFPDLIFNQHVLQCLKEQFQSSTYGLFKYKTKHKQISQDEKLAQKLHAELNKNTPIANDSLESDKILCCICKTELTYLSSLQRTQHINACIDQSESAKAHNTISESAKAHDTISESAKAHNTISESVVICPMCGLQFKSFSLREMHFETCARDKFIAPGEHVTNVLGQSSRLTANKKQSKSRKTSNSKKSPDDQLQLALAMSNSLQEEQNKQEEQLSRCIQNIKKEVFKELKHQKNKHLPLLITFTAENRQACYAEKVAGIMNENFENVHLTKRHKYSSLASTEPTNLWLKSSLTQTDSSKLPFYVNSLMPPIKMDVVNMGNRSKCLSRNAGSVISPNTTDSVNVEEKQQLVAPSQTALILAEMADDNESSIDSVHTPVGNVSPNFQAEVYKEFSTGILTSLSTDLCRLVNNPSFSDVQFKTADGTKVFGHKIILQLRCPNILNRISTHLETTTINLSEVSHDLLLVFLKYIYAGQLNIDETQVNNLKILSQELEIPELFHACEKMIKKSVNHSRQSSGFYPSPLTTVDSMIDYLLESSDEDLENKKNCSENPNIDRQTQNYQNNNQSTVTRDSIKFLNSRNTSPNVISPSSIISVYSPNGNSSDNGNNLDYLTTVSVSSQLSASVQLSEINCDNQPNKPFSNNETINLCIDKTDSKPCDTESLQKSPLDSTSSQNIPHSLQSEKCFVVNKNALHSFTSSLPGSTNLTDDYNHNSENKEQYQLNNTGLIKKVSQFHFIGESNNDSPCFSPKTNPNCDDMITPKKKNINNSQENVSNNVLSISDDLSNMSKELFSEDEDLESEKNNTTSIQYSFDNQHELSSPHQMLKNVSPCHNKNEPNFSKYCFASPETISLTKDSNRINNSPNVNNNVTVNPVCTVNYKYQSITSRDESEKEFTSQSFSTENDSNLGENFDFLNSYSPVFPKTQEMKETSKNLNENQSWASSENQNKKRKRCSLCYSPPKRKKMKEKLGTEESSHLTLYDRSCSILNSDNPYLGTKKEERFSQKSSLNSSDNLYNDTGNKGYKLKSKRNIITVPKDSFVKTHQYKSDSKLDISSDTHKDISETNNLQTSPKQSKNPKTNKESANCVSPISNSSYENDGIVIYEESYIPDDIDETPCGEILFSKLNSFIQNNPDLYRKILLYEPLDFDVLKKKLEESNIKCSDNKLLEYLDNQCITFMLDKDKQNKKKFYSPPKRKKVKEKLETEKSSHLNLYDRNCLILNSDEPYLETKEEEGFSQKFSLNSSDNLYNDKDLQKAKQFDNVINKVATSDLKKLPLNTSNDFCSTKEYQLEKAEKPKKRFVFKTITEKSLICSSTESKSVDIVISDCRVKSFSESSTSDYTLRNNESLELNHNLSENIWEPFYDDHIDDSVVIISPVSSHSKVNFYPSKDKLDLAPVVDEQHLDHSLTHDCSYASIVDDVKHLSILESELNCNLSDMFENSDLKIKPNPSEKFDTPVNVNHQTNYCEIEQRIPSPFTPMPDYDKMSTPGLKKEMKKYGCKARPKKNMIKVLKDIFTKTHQYKSDSELDISRDTHNDISDTNILEISPKSKNSKRNKKSPKSISPVSNSSYENDGIVIYEESYIADDIDEIPSSQQPNGEILFSKLNSFIQNNPDLYRKILMYEPLDFDILKKNLEESNIKCSANKLLEYLDNQCITFVLGKDKQDKKKAHRGSYKQRRARKV